MKSRPVIALVAASLDILGGQGIQARALAEYLREEGNDVTFIPVNPRFPSPLRWMRRLPVLRTVLNELLYLPSLVRLRRADVAHIFSASYWSFLLGPVPAMVAARLFGQRVVLNYHSGEADDHLANWGSLVHPWLRLADEIVVPSAYLQDVFASHGYTVRVIPNIIDTARLAFRERRPLRPYLLSTRNLERPYGVDVVLRSFAQIKSRYPDATLTIAGYGREEEALRDLAASLGVKDITFVGRQEPADMAALYDAAHVFVNASTIDNQPVSVLEAFACGLPVVSTPTGDIKHMISDGRNGLLVAPNDSAALTAAVTRLLDDPALARSMARRAREAVERHTWSHVQHAWLDTYDQPRRRRRPVTEFGQTP